MIEATDFATAEFLRALGIDPRTVERVVFDHRVGGVPVLTVFHVAHKDDWGKAVSELTRVYELKAVRGE